MSTNGIKKEGRRPLLPPTLTAGNKIHRSLNRDYRLRRVVLMSIKFDG